MQYDCPERDAGPPSSKLDKLKIDEGPNDARPWKFGLDKVITCPEDFDSWCHGFVPSLRDIANVPARNAGSRESSIAEELAQWIVEHYDIEWYGDDHAPINTFREKVKNDPKMAKDIADVAWGMAVEAVQNMNSDDFDFGG